MVPKQLFASLSPFLPDGEDVGFISRQCQTLWSYVRAEPVRALLVFIYLSSGSLKVIAPQPLQATFQYGHPLWLYRTSGLMELGVVRSVLPVKRQQPQVASALSYTFLGGVLYTITAFPQQLPNFLVQSKVMGPVARAATYLPSLATVALTAYYQRMNTTTSSERKRKEVSEWTMSDWGCQVIQPMLFCISAGVVGGHAFAIKRN